MFMQLWQRVVGEGEDAEARKKALLDGDDETELSTENEDEIADRMLTQFPEYGAFSEAVGKQGSSDDWMDDDLGDELFDEPVFHISRAANQGDQVSRGFAKPPNPVQVVGSLRSTPDVAQDWDPQEQSLWKPSRDIIMVEASVKERTVQDRDASSVYLSDTSRQKWVNSRNNYANSDGTAAVGVTTPNGTVAHRMPTYSFRPPHSYGTTNRVECSTTERQSLSPHMFPLVSRPSPLEDDDDRQHWMPDQLCRECYRCEQPFTVFRRRHHCRLCGQVFCSVCSAYFVEWDEQKTLRACQSCFENVQRGVITLPSSQNAPLPSHHTTSSADHHHGTSPAAVAESVLPQHRDQPLLEPMDEYLETTQRERSMNDASVIAETTAAAAARKRDTRQEVAAGRHLGMTAANHLEQLGTSLIHSDAPLLLKNIDSEDELQSWIATLMMLATKCCATIRPDVKHKGDLLDIRPYCKVKVISGGSHADCAYLSGVFFRKQVSHKSMAKELLNPRIMLLSGGLEFTRTENRIASLDTLLEQEDKYFEILVGKLLKAKPDILMVGRSVSRKAQELLLRANVVLIQHVKSHLMSRIARQTGATVVSSTEHAMNQFGSNVILGQCRRFRLVTFRDNELWSDTYDQEKRLSAREADSAKGEVVVMSSLDEPPTDTSPRIRRNIGTMLRNKELKNHERQAVLAADLLGETVLDGSEAVKGGLAKRGVAQTFILLEGCPKHLGCTVVLRGANREALKQVKRVFHFLINVAYNLRLEASYLRERCARLSPEYIIKPEFLFSSSLCVNYGSPPSGRKVRPWNGGAIETVQRSISGEITALDHQSILITSVWMTDKTQCCPAEVKGICYYSQQDVSLGQFLRDSCFNLSLKCQNPTCKKSVLDHSLSFIHNDGLINITVEQMEDPLPPSPLENSGGMDGSNSDDSESNEDSPIATWTYCNNCTKVVSPLVYISEDTWRYSFGKFLEVFFYNRDAQMNSPEHGCSCQMQTAATLYFGCGRLAARFTYEPVKPFGVFVRRSLPIDESLHRRQAVRHLELISKASSQLFIKFDDHIDKVSREARLLLRSAVNRPEHLQTVLSELNMIASEVDHAAKTLQEKIASVSEKCRTSSDTNGVVNEALFRFPWHSRRYLFMLTSAWNERLSAAGQAIAAMKKLAVSSQLAGGQRSDVVPTIVGDGFAEDLLEGMRRLRQLNEVYSKLSVSDISTAFPTFSVGEKRAVDLLEEDDDMDDPDGAIQFSDGVDADVLASRRRLKNSKHVDGLSSRSERKADLLNERPRKSLGTQHGSMDAPPLAHSSSRVPRYDAASPSLSVSDSHTITKVTPGGAVKSAITRFFNRGGRELDPYVVDLGIFKDGRPRLEPGMGSIVVPVVDEQPSTIIAYSLSSADYEKQFKRFSRMASAPSTGTGKALSGPSNQDRAGDSSSGGAQMRRGSEASAMNEILTKERSDRSRSFFSTDVFLDEKKDIERRLLSGNKSHIKHTFRDYDEKGQQTCKFVCTTYWATQFHAVRQAFLAPSSRDQHSAASSSLNIEQSYVQSLLSAYSWDASGGKSGASFARTMDGRFVIKCISRTELQMFLDCAPAYFEYLNKAFFHGLPTVLCKILGVYQLGSHNRITGKRTMEQVAVMQNIFYGKKITKTFDLKGSLRGRFARHLQSVKDSETPTQQSASDRRVSTGHSDSEESDDNSSGGNDCRMAAGKHDNLEDGSASHTSTHGTLLDGDFLEFTNGRPLPLGDRAKAVFHMSVLNDTLFLSIINVLDYSILVGIDEENSDLVVGIIDFMRQYDILKQMERVGKSLPMVVGSEAPTIIQPPLYKARFTNAMERYFMTVPSKWTSM